jgi:hypothetical protein
MKKTVQRTNNNVAATQAPGSFLCYSRIDTTQHNQTVPPDIYSNVTSRHPTIDDGLSLINADPQELSSKLQSRQWGGITTRLRLLTKIYDNLTWSFLVQKKRTNLNASKHVGWIFELKKGETNIWFIFCVAPPDRS